MSREANFDELQVELVRAVARDLREHHRLNARPARRRVRVLLGLGAGVAIAVPGVAYAAGVFAPSSSPSAVATSMPAGTSFFGHTNPRCAVITAGAEYRCTVDPPTTYTGPGNPDAKGSLPASQSGIAPGHFLGVIETTADAHQRTTGGCRATDANGTHWDCYLGESAVRQGMISQRLLGSMPIRATTTGSVQQVPSAPGGQG